MTTQGLASQARHLDHPEPGRSTGQARLRPPELPATRPNRALGRQTSATSAASPLHCWVAERVDVAPTTPPLLRLPREWSGHGALATRPAPGQAHPCHLLAHHGRASSLSSGAVYNRIGKAPAVFLNRGEVPRQVRLRRDSMSETASRYFAPLCHQAGQLWPPGAATLCCRGTSWVANHPLSNGQMARLGEATESWPTTVNSFHCFRRAELGAHAGHGDPGPLKHR